MAIGGIIFSLSTTEICGIIFRRVIFVIGIAIFHRATSAICSIVIYSTITAMHCKHNNQPKERCTAKMPVTEAKQQATTS